MPKVVVSGDRDGFGNGDAIRHRLAQLDKETVVITGAAKGVDRQAYYHAGELGLDRISIPANWVRYGKPAGAIRNRVMLDFEPDLVIAFHHNLAESKGTKDCVTEARRRGIPVEVIS